ncbi:MAG TPA: hypothetical protein ENN39_09665 [Desulfonatronum sp.]|nr:hypothetical protein [Desulfonatronum sp.]
MAITVQSMAMPFLVRNSKQAIQVNFQIMRTFTKLRRILATHEDLRRTIEDMEAKYDEQFRVVCRALRSCRNPRNSRSGGLGLSKRM